MFKIRKSHSVWEWLFKYPDSLFTEEPILHKFPLNKQEVLIRHIRNETRKYVLTEHMYYYTLYIHKVVPDN